MPKPYRPIICTCHNCHTPLSYHYHDSKQIWIGGPWYCGYCGVNVTEDVYGKKPDKKQPEESQTA